MKNFILILVTLVSGLASAANYTPEQHINLVSGNAHVIALMLSTNATKDACNRVNETASSIEHIEKNFTDFARLNRRIIDFIDNTRQEMVVLKLYCGQNGVSVRVRSGMAMNAAMSMSDLSERYFTNLK